MHPPRLLRVPPCLPVSAATSAPSSARPDRNVCANRTLTRALSLHLEQEHLHMKYAGTGHADITK
jgi:hypothetical protein